MPQAIWLQYVGLSSCGIVKRTLELLFQNAIFTHACCAYILHASALILSACRCPCGQSTEEARKGFDIISTTQINGTSCVQHLELYGIHSRCRNYQAIQSLAMLESQQMCDGHRQSPRSDCAASWLGCSKDLMPFARLSPPRACARQSHCILTGARSTSPEARALSK